MNPEITYQVVCNGSDGSYYSDEIYSLSSAILHAKSVIGWGSVSILEKTTYTKKVWLDGK